MRQFQPQFAYPPQYPGLQQSMSINARLPQQNVSSTRPLKAPQQSYQFQPQPIYLPQPNRQMQYNNAPYNQQHQIYQSPLQYQPVIQQTQFLQQIPRQQSFVPQQMQSSFRHQVPQFGRANMQQQFIPSSPARVYQNLPVQHQSTPNRLNQTQFNALISQQLQIPQMNSQVVQVQNYQQPPQNQQIHVALQGVHQRDQQQQQLNKDLEKKFDDAINKTKQIVSKYQKPEEPKQNGNQAYENDNEVQSERNDDNLQDLALQYEDGYIYRGQGIEPSIRQGYGILCDQQENEVYSGYWQDNQYHGQGRLVNFQAEQIDGGFDYADLNLIENGWIGFEGGFNEGKMTGKGVLTLTNGEKFDGTFEDGTIEGVGTFYTLEDQAVQGLWRDGVLEQEFQQ